MFNPNGIPCTHTPPSLGNSQVFDKYCFPRGMQLTASSACVRHHQDAEEHVLTSGCGSRPDVDQRRFVGQTMQGSVVVVRDSNEPFMPGNFTNIPCFDVLISSLV